MSKLLIVLFCFIQFGCATKRYMNDGQPNFQVTFKDSGAFHESAKLEVYVFEVKNDCTTELLGAVEVPKGNPRNIALPVGKTYATMTMLEQGGWFKNDSLKTDTPYPIKPKKGEIYQFEVEIDDGAVGRNYYQMKGKKRVDLEAAKFPNENCEYTYNWSHWW